MHTPATRAVAVDLPAAVTAAFMILDAAEVAFGWLDDGGRLHRANKALLSSINRSSLPFDGIVLDASADDAQRWRAAVARASASETGIRVPLMRFRAEGERVDVQLLPLEGIGGMLLEAVAAHTPAAVSVAASLRSLAHELKNPLGGLRGAAQLLSRRVLDADLRAYAEIIVAEVDRLDALTRRILLPATHSAITAINVHSVLERVRLLLAAEGAQIDRDYDPSLPDCIGDHDRLVQVVLNLVRNAVEAGSARIILRTRFEDAALLERARGPALRVDVLDNGGGVPDAVRSIVFLPLVSGREGGTGLGLATAHEIVAEHGGRIAFESRPGHTVFSVWLPIVEGAD